MDIINCMIVDDERDAIARLKQLLKNFNNIKILTTEDVAERTCKKIVQYNPDIVFLDVEMPNKTGFEIIDEVRKLNADPTFILTTAFSQYAIKAIREAAFDFLLKPIDIDDLKETLKRYELKRKMCKKIPQSFINKYSLTDREVEIAYLLLKGNDSKEIADELSISKDTVDTHRRNILHKTNTENTTKLTALINSL